MEARRYPILGVKRRIAQTITQTICASAGHVAVLVRFSCQREFGNAADSLVESEELPSRSESLAMADEFGHGVMPRAFRVDHHRIIPAKMPQFLALHEGRVVDVALVAL